MVQTLSLAQLRLRAVAVGPEYKPTVQQQMETLVVLAAVELLMELREQILALEALETHQALLHHRVLLAVIAQQAAQIMVLGVVAAHPQLGQTELQLRAVTEVLELLHL
jgi:hypothetical protein